MNLLETAEAYFAVKQDATRIVLKEPRKCACGRMVMFVINRDGKTRCVECDYQYRKNKLT